MGIIGDGTAAEGDLHDTMHAASVWQLPLIVLITDNRGRDQHLARSRAAASRISSAYAEGFGMRHFTCDGRDFFDTYRVDLRGRRNTSRKEQKPVLFHVTDLPRFNGHSSAADVTFDLSQDDPLIAFGEQLVAEGILEQEDIMVRKKGSGRDFFAHHEPGRIMDKEIEDVRTIIDQVREEPDPPLDSIHDQRLPPVPRRHGPKPGEGHDVRHVRGRHPCRGRCTIVSDHGGILWGQDVAKLGGVMTATAGLESQAPGPDPRYTAQRAARGRHRLRHLVARFEIVAMPEIQFGDYSLNTMHWLVHMGNLYWATNGNTTYSMIVRMPTDPFGGGAMYHSMSLDGYFSPIPGLVLVMPSTSYDIYGLLLTAAEYGGPGRVPGAEVDVPHGARPDHSRASRPTPTASRP